MNVLEKLTALENEASQFGFKWENTQQVMAQIQSECSEVNDHLANIAVPAEKIKLQEEIGDLLHAVFSLCVFCQFDATETLEKSVAKFERRFNSVKQLAHDQGITTLEGRSFAELMKFWDLAKQTVG